MNWTSVVLVLSAIASYSQDRKFVLKKGSEFYEEFYVLKSDKSIKDGTYVKYANGVAGVEVLESGTYKKGKKDGVWEYYYDLRASIFDKTNDSNSLKMKGAYVNDKKNGVWGTFYLDTIPNHIMSRKFGKKQRPDSLNVNIVQNDLRLRSIGQYLNDKRVAEWVGFDGDGSIEQRYNFSTSQLIFDSTIEDSLKYNIDRHALFIGGDTNFGSYLFFEFDFRSGTKDMKKDSAFVTVRFTIDQERKVGDIVLLESNAHRAMQQEALRQVKLFDDNWLPAMQNGQRIKSSCKLTFYISKKMKGTRTTYLFDYDLYFD